MFIDIDARCAIYAAEISRRPSAATDPAHRGRLRTVAAGEARS
jgi:hypothetical protein